MKCPFAYAAVIIATMQTTTRAMHYAVSPMSGFEQFYLQTKNARSFENRNEDSPGKKMDICAAIFNSTLFRTRYQCQSTPLDAKAVENELKQKYSHIYQETRNVNNALKARSINVNGRLVQERVFYCLARESQSGKISQYFVTSEYDVRTGSQAKKMTLGRFIFNADDKVVALAEEPCDVQEDNLSSIEQSFWNKVYASYYTKWRSDDAVCKLNAFQKLRLCNCIMNSEAYRGRVEFSPDTKNVESQCQLREVRFDYEQPAIKSDQNEYVPVGPVIEWMISCTGQHMATRQPVTRYILRGSEKYDYYQHYVGMGIDNMTFLECSIGEKKKGKEREEEDEQDNQQQQKQGGQQQEEQQDDDDDDGGGGFFGSAFGGGGFGRGGSSFKIFI